MLRGALRRRVRPAHAAGPRPQHGAAHNSCITGAASGCGALHPRFCRSYARVPGAACCVPGVGSRSARNQRGHGRPAGRGGLGRAQLLHYRCRERLRGAAPAVLQELCARARRRVLRAGHRASAHPPRGTRAVTRGRVAGGPGGRPVRPVGAAHNSCITCAASGCGALDPRFCRSSAHRLTPRRAARRLRLRAAPAAGSGSAPSPAGLPRPPPHASRRIRAVTRVPNASASTGTRSSAAWNCPNTSKFAGTRSGTKP